MKPRPSRFENPLCVRLLAGRWQWELIEPLRWCTPDGMTYSVPAGFVTDFASVPRWLRPIALNEARTAMAATVHDYMYRVTRPGRRWADDVFYHTLRSSGVGAAAAWLYWVAVRIGGRRAYRG